MKRHIPDRSRSLPQQYLFDSRFLVDGQAASTEFYVSFEARLQIDGAKPKQRRAAEKPCVLLDDGTKVEADYEHCGPRISLYCIDRWLAYALCEPDIALPARFSFEGARIGDLRKQELHVPKGREILFTRPIRTVKIAAHFTRESLDFSLDGTTGPVSGIDGELPPDTKPDSASFEIAFSIPAEFVPDVLFLGQYDTNFRNRLKALHR